MTNICKFNGNLTKDAQFSVTPNGKKLYKFTLATSTGKPKMENGQPVKNGDKTVYEVQYVDFAAFGNVAESLVNGSLHPLLAKGAFVKVEARFDGVNAYSKQDGSPAGSANFVITSSLDVSVLGVSSNQREDGATYQPKTRSNNQQSYQQGQQQGYSNNQNQQYGQQQQFGGQQQFNGGQQQFSGQQFGGQGQFGGYEDPNENLPF